MHLLIVILSPGLRTHPLTASMHRIGNALSYIGISGPECTTLLLSLINIHKGLALILVDVIALNVLDLGGLKGGMITLFFLAFSSLR